MSDFDPPDDLKQTVKWFAQHGWIVMEGFTPPEAPFPAFKVRVDPTALSATAMLIKMRLEKLGIPLGSIDADVQSKAAEQVMIQASFDPVDGHTEIMVIGLDDNVFARRLPS